MTLAPGTAASEWTKQPRLQELPLWSFELPARVLVVSPHPDDETLGVGGIIHMLSSAHCQVEVLALSDGEAAFPEAEPDERRELARVRRLEQTSALALLGLPEQACRRERLPDGELSAYPDLAQRIAACLHGVRYCLAPYRGDGHPDHEASGHAALEACARTGAQLCEYLVWAWHWQNPGAADFLWSRGRRVLLDASAQHAKASAVAAYASQTRGFGRFRDAESIVPETVLAHFRRDFEVLLV